MEPQVFIQETGKAGVVQLYNLAPPGILAKVVAGDRVQLSIEGSNLTVESSRGEYLGQVEPRYGQRLVRLMEGGNRYTSAIVSSSENRVTVIIREICQVPSQKDYLSFPSRVVENPRTNIVDRVIKRELEQEEASLGESGYTVVGGEESESLTDESLDSDDETDNEE